MFDQRFTDDLTAKALRVDAQAAGYRYAGEKEMQRVAQGLAADLRAVVRGIAALEVLEAEAKALDQTS